MGAATSIDCVARERDKPEHGGSSSARLPPGAADGRVASVSSSAEPSWPATPWNQPGFNEQWREQFARLARLAWLQEASSSSKDPGARLGPNFGVGSSDLAKLLPGQSELLKKVLQMTAIAATSDEEAVGLLYGLSKALSKVADVVKVAIDKSRSPASALKDRSPKIDLGSSPMSKHKPVQSENGLFHVASEPKMERAMSGVPSKAQEVLDGIFMDRENEGYANKVATTLLERHLGRADPPLKEVIDWRVLQDMVDSLSDAWQLAPTDARLIQRMMKRQVFSDSLEEESPQLALSMRLSGSQSSLGMDFDESQFVLTVGTFLKTFPRAIQRVWRRYRPAQVAGGPTGGVQRRAFLRAGTRVSFEDKYSVKMEMGGGSFGTVALCMHKISGCLRAVKTITRSGLEEDMDREFKVLAHLDHPNIVRVFEVIEDEAADKVHIAMDAVLGGNLKDAIQAFSFNATKVVDPGDMDYIEAWSAIVMVQLFKGVQYCHARGIVHCDLKPQNVLMMPTAMEEPPRVVICDFGIADVARTHVPEGGANLSGLKGTPAYMPPETFLGSGSGVKSDIWSLGVILFESLGRGQLPFKAANILLLSKKICYDEPDWADMGCVEGVQLCKMFLRKVESERPSAPEALAATHLWSQKCTWTWTCQPSHSATIADWSKVHDIPHKLHNLHRRSHLERCVMACIGSQMNMAQLSNLSIAFEKYDQDHSGFLDHGELCAALKDFGIQEEEAQLVAKELDTDGSGTVDYSEFVAGCLSVREEWVMKQLRVAFSIFDLDGNGYLDRNELHYALTNHGIIDDKEMDGGVPLKSSTSSASWRMSSMTNSEASVEVIESADQDPSLLEDLLGDGITLDELLDELDTSGDGRISYEEFQQYFRHSSR